MKMTYDFLERNNGMCKVIAIVNQLLSWSIVIFRGRIFFLVKEPGHIV